MPNHPLNSDDPGLSPALRELEDALRAMSPADRGPDSCRVFFELGRASMRARARAWKWGASACAAGLALSLAIPALWTTPDTRAPFSTVPLVSDSRNAADPALSRENPEMFRLASRSRAITRGIDAVDALAPDTSSVGARGASASELIESGRVVSERVPNLVRLLSGVVR